MRLVPYPSSLSLPYPHFLQLSRSELQLLIIQLVLLFSTMGQL